MPMLPPTDDARVGLDAKLDRPAVDLEGTALVPLRRGRQQVEAVEAARRKVQSLSATGQGVLGPGPGGGRMRHTSTYAEDGSLTVLSETSTEADQWLTAFEARYERRE